MHNYQVDDQIRNRVFLICGVLAIAAAYALSWVLQNIPLQPPWWLDLPSVLGFFGIFYWLFDHYLWRLTPFQRIDALYIPDLDGVWSTHIETSYSDFEGAVDATTTIRQTASKICIAMETPSSTSDSFLAALVRTERRNMFELYYLYENRPKAGSVDTMSIHQGTAWLQIAPDCQSLQGEYYSGRGRQNYGRIQLKRLGPK